MNRTRQKNIAFLLYISYIIILIFVISFGGALGLSAAATEAFQYVLTLVAPEKHIEDVILQKDTFTVGKYHVLEYDIVGDYRGDPSLRFEPLDDVFDSFSKTGSFKIKSIEGESLTARIRVTSGYDSDFEKILTVTVAKKYPEKFELNYLSLSAGHDTYAFVGVPISPYLTIPKSEEYSHEDFELIYDPEYFSLTENGYLMPIKATANGEKITFACRCPNGAYAESEPFTIQERQTEESFDEVRVWYGGKWTDISEVTFQSGKNYVPAFYKDGKRFFTGYEIEIAGNKNDKKTSQGFINFNTPDLSSLTLRLPGGFEKTIEVNVFNELVMPEVSGEAMGADGTVRVTDSAMSVLRYEFGNDVYFHNLDFEYDKKALSLTSSGGKIRLQGLREGETTLTLVLDDGEQRLEKTLTVYVESTRTVFEKIYDEAHNIMAKSLGHFLSFGVLAVFAANLFRFAETKKRLSLFLLYSSGAFASACITEFIQIFMPTRTARFTDIAIDMLGFYIGTAAVILAVAAVRKLRIRKIKA